MYPSWIRAVEVLLNTLFDTGARVSGQTTDAAGFSGSSFSMRPPRSIHGLEQTGVETAISPEVRAASRHQVWPVLGSSEVTASCVQTMSCFRPPALTMMGELSVKE